MTAIMLNDGQSMPAYIAEPSTSPSPGLVLIQEIFGINKTMRDIADAYARKGFYVVCPDLFWREQPGIELDSSMESDRARAFELYEKLDEDVATADCGAALAFARSQASCNGSVGAVGFCLGGKLAYLLATRHDPDCVVGYYGVGIENALDEAKNIRCPVLLHVAGNDQFCPPPAQQQIHKSFDKSELVSLFNYKSQNHAFARVGGEHYDASAAELANLRTLECLRDHLGWAGSSKAVVDFAALWEEHIKYEFETRNHVDTLETMVHDAYVNHIPTLTGGVGKEALTEFYANRFIPQMPPDTEMTPVSRTIGTDRLVDEMIFKFTHTIEMDWMLPGIAPTGKRVEIALVAIVHFRGNKLAHEHIYWDQASVLVQLGLLASDKLPVMGIETAQKVLDNNVPSNVLINRADEWRKSQG